MVYKTLNNKFCKEIVRLSLEKAELENLIDRKRVQAFIMLSNCSSLLSESVLVRLWSLVGKSLLPYLDRNKIPTFAYFRFLQRVIPVLKKGGVIIDGF